MFLSWNSMISYSLTDKYEYNSFNKPQTNSSLGSNDTMYLPFDALIASTRVCKIPRLVLYFIIEQHGNVIEKLIKKLIELSMELPSENINS